jgi:hypothetical protein
MKNLVSVFQKIRKINWIYTREKQIWEFLNCFVEKTAIFSQKKTMDFKIMKYGSNYSFREIAHLCVISVF